MAKSKQSSLQLATVNPQSIPVTNPQDLKAVYSNHFGLSATMTDFTIYFFELGQMPGPKEAIRKQEMKAIVTLPIMAAAGLVDVLSQMMKGHAEQIGAIGTSGE